MISFQVQSKNRIHELRRELRPRMQRVIDETATEIAAIARQLCPVDTGNLRDSIAVINYSGHSSSYGMAKAVLAGMSYAIFAEFGTSTSSATPFLRPALEAVRPRLERRLRYIFKL